MPLAPADARLGGVEGAGGVARYRLVLRVAQLVVGRDERLDLVAEGRARRRPHVGEEGGVVESVKAASDIYAPVSGAVAEINDSLEDSPETVNQDPYGDGWFFKLKVTDERELDDLLDAEAYQELCESEDQ